MTGTWTQADLDEMEACAFCEGLVRRDDAQQVWAGGPYVHPHHLADYLRSEQYRRATEDGKRWQFDRDDA